METSRKILFIEICNFNDYPIGGYLAFSKQMIESFKSQLVLVGMTTDYETPVGKWIKKEINGNTYDFFAVRRVNPSHKKPLIPGRIKSYLAVRWYRKRILSCGLKNILIQTPEVLLALGKLKGLNLCSRIPGTENPLSISRYKYSKYFTKIFDFIFFRALKKSNIILASADEPSIDRFLLRSNGRIDRSRVIQFPTRIDTNIFKPQNQSLARDSLNLSHDETIIVTSGRLSDLKGWKFLLDSFIHFKKINPKSKFIFLGDGESREKIKAYIKHNDIINDVQLPGRMNHKDLVKYINASDLFVMGSYVEGWATSLAEAISCSKPIVSTNYSSAKQLIIDGYNGYIISDRDSNHFSELMKKALCIPKENLDERSNAMIEYSTERLKKSLLKIWKLQ